MCACASISRVCVRARARVSVHACVHVRAFISSALADLLLVADRASEEDQVEEIEEVEEEGVKEALDEGRKKALQGPEEEGVQEGALRPMLLL